MWNVMVRVPRVDEADVALYRVFTDGILSGSATQPTAGDAQVSFSIPDDGRYSITARSVDGQGNESPDSEAMLADLDHVAPSAPAKLVLVAATWVP